MGGGMGAISLHFLLKDGPQNALKTEERKAGHRLGKNYLKNVKTFILALANMNQRMHFLSQSKDVSSNIFPVM